MRVLLLCLLQVLAKASWADVAAARVNGVEIEVARPSAISASTDAQWPHGSQHPQPDAVQAPARPGHWMN